MNLKLKILYLMLLSGLLTFLLLFIASGFYIGRSVKKQCQEAKKEYGGDCVEALITLVNDESKSFRQRNSAIWALGQLGDRRTFPVLAKYYTGNIPSREPVDKAISQYELKKAIKLVRGSFNAPAGFWRYRIDK